MVEALSGGRWQGSSALEATADFTDNFTSDTPWTFSRAGTEIQITGGKMVFTDFQNGGQWRSAYRSTGLDINDTKWVLRFKFRFSTATSQSFWILGLSSGTSDPTGGSQYMVGAYFVDTPYMEIAKKSSSDSYRSWTGGNVFNPSANTDYYIQIIRTGETEVQMKMFTNSNFSDGLVGTNTQTIDSNYTGLDTLMISNQSNGSSSRTMTGEIDDIQIWNGVTSTTEDEKDSLTNVPENTRYEETNTRKIYRAGSVEPVFHYKFSEASGDVINHGSVASSNLTVTNLTRDQSTPSGLGNGMKTTAYNTGYAQNTSRVNDYKFLHDGTSKWSISFWLKSGDTPTDSTSTERMIFGNIWTDDNGIGFAIRLAKNSDNSSSECRIQTLIADGDSGMPLNDQTPNGMMPDVSNWHFYCITYDPTLSSNNLTVSRDASTSGTGFHQGDYDDVAYSTSNPTRKTTYFARPTSSYDHGIVGTLAQVIIWKGHILTQAEKVSLYASGNGTTTLPSPLEWKERNTA